MQIRKINQFYSYTSKIYRTEKMTKPMRVYVANIKLLLVWS